VSGDLSAPANPLEITVMHVSHYRDKGKDLVGDLSTSAAAVRVNDDVQVVAKFSAPAYCYLIAFNPDGEDQLCLPQDADGNGAPKTPPDARAEVRYPREKHVFVLDVKGLQVFVLVASKNPLPPYEVWRKRAGDIPWKGMRYDGPWRWHFAGGEFTRLPQVRGRVEAADGPPEPLQKLCEFFNGRREFDVVQAIAFSVVTDDRK
jgi:hypothetical protein